MIVIQVVFSTTKGLLTWVSGIISGDHHKGPRFESSAGDLSSEVVNSLNYSATNLSDLSD